ncbi:glycosyltransferase [Flavicella sp.]|uniref:glycosyltransferase family 2 protein n=1 Tax=Flavicella sp. TaxID=2957742 RepID=UPI00301740CE
MSELPIVSIVCSCYNHRDYVIDSIKSVLSQLYVNIELIVVDDFSSDDSVQVIKNFLISYPEVRFIQNKSNLGLNKSFNRAVKTSKGEYLIDLAADDLLLPHSVQCLVGVFLKAKNPNLALVFGNATDIDKNKVLGRNIINDLMIPKIHQAVKNGYYKYLLKDSDYICSVSGLYNRRIFDELNGYDENLNFEDLDYWLRATKDYKILFVEHIVVYKRYLESSLGSGFAVSNDYTKKLQESFYLILEKAYFLNSNSDEYLALLKRILEQSKWAIKTMCFKYLYLYVILYCKSCYKYLRV